MLQRDRFSAAVSEDKEKQLKQKWIMTMVSIQRGEDEEEERIELNAEVEYSKGRDGMRMICYDEPDIYEEGKINKMRILVRGNEAVSICRTGLFQTHMRIQTDRCNYSQYETPIGTVNMSIIAKYIKSELTDEGGSLGFRYTVTGTGGLISDVEILLEIHKQ